MPQIILAMNRMHIKACCVSTNVADSEATLALAESGAPVIPFVGIHPQFASSGDLDCVEHMLDNGRACGVGEIGLDPTYDVGLSQQMDIFVAQLEMAERLGLPVSVHSRKSLDMILDTLSSFRCTVLLHWFEGSKGKLRRAMDADMYVSYGPLAVYAADKRRLLSISRPDKILVETDGPVSFGRCFGNMNATPAFLPSVVLCVADTLKLSYGDAAGLLEQNTLSFLHV